MPDQGPFPQDALGLNRSGRLSEQQRRQLSTQSTGLRRGQLSFALLCTVLALIALFGASPKTASDRVLISLFGVALLIIAGFLVVRSFTGADPLTKDARSGRVESVEGAIAKRKVEAVGEDSHASYYFEVGGKSISVSYAAYEAAPDAGYVRIFFLPATHRLVNMVRLPDRPLPEGAPSHQEILRIAATALGSHDAIKSAEAHAQLAALENKYGPHPVGEAPPADKVDPRPLAQSILGSWTNGMVSVTFAAAGTMCVQMPGGGERTGHWSVGADGQLVADVMGRMGGTSAWVAGDELTISMGNMALTLSRVP